MVNAKKRKKDFNKHFREKGLHRSLIDTPEKTRVLEDWFQKQDWSKGSEGDWERFLFFRSFSDKPADALLILQLMPHSGMDPAPIARQSWPFPIQHSLETIIGSEGNLQPKSYITLFEAMIHLHFVVLASQFYWAMECHPELDELCREQEIFCAYQTIFDAMTDRGCQGGNVWADRGCLITLGANGVTSQLPFPEFLNILEPETLTIRSGRGKQSQTVFSPGHGGRVRDLIRFASEVRNKFSHMDQLSPEGMALYQGGLDLLLDCFGMIFAGYNGKGLAVVDERSGSDGHRHQGIFCYWDGDSCLISTNPTRSNRQTMRSLWDGKRPENIDIIPAPPPPSGAPFWDESLLFFDPAAPYERYIYLMPFGFRYAHRRMRDEPSGRQYIPGLVDSVRWSNDRVNVIIQRTYAGFGYDVTTYSDKIPDEEGIDHKQHHSKSMEHIAAGIMNRYGLNIPKTARVFDKIQHKFDLQHSKEALKLAEQTVPRQAALNAVEQALLDRMDQRLILMGASGRGKTHIAAQFYKRHESRSVYLSFDCGIHVIQEDIKDQEEEDGGGSLSASIRMHLFAGLCNVLQVVDLPTVILGQGTVESRIRSMIGDLNVTEPIYLVVDGLNQCPDPEQAFLSLPDPLPPNLYLLVTTQPIDTVLRQITHNGRKTWGQMELAPLTKKETQQMINFYWHRPNEKKLSPLTENITTRLWSTCQGQPIFVMAWTEELRKLYNQDPILFEDKALRLLNSSKGLGLPEALKDRFEAVLEGFSPRKLGKSICLVLSMIQRALTEDEICRGLKALQKRDLPEFIHPPSFSTLQVEDFMGRMGGFFHRDDTNSGYRFIHETFSRWYQRSIPEELIPDIRLTLASLGCMQLTPESRPDAISLWVDRVDEQDPLYEDLPPTVRLGLLLFLREYFEKKFEKERYYSLLFDLVDTYYNRLGEPTRSLPLEQEAEQGLQLNLSELTKGYLFAALGRIYYTKVNYDRALTFFKNGVSILEKMPENSRTKKMLWLLTYSYSRIGELYTWKGNYPNARTAHEKCFQIRQSFVEEHPSEQNLRLLSMAQVKMGQVNSHMGELEQALKHHHRALEIREALVAKHPSAINRMYLAMLCSGFIGSAYRNMGDTDKGLQFSRRGMEIRQQLYDELPTNKHAAQLTFSYNGLSLFFRHQGKLSDAIDCLRKAVALGGKLAKEVPTIANRGNLSGYYNSLGCVSKASGDISAAIEYLLVAVNMRETLLSEAWTFMRRRVLGFSYEHLANAYLMKNSFSEALRYATKAVDILEPVEKESPVKNSRRRLANVYKTMSDILLTKGDLNGALGYGLKSLDLAKALQKQSSFLMDQRILPTIYHKLAYIHHAMGNMQEAFTLAAQAVEILEGLTEKTPVLDNRKELSEALAVMAAVQKSLGEHDEAVAAIIKAITIMENMIREAPEMVEYPTLLRRYQCAIVEIG